MTDNGREDCTVWGVQSAEDAIRASGREGMSLREAREKHRYHQLQSRPKA